MTPNHTEQPLTNTVHVGEVPVALSEPSTNLSNTDHNNMPKAVIIPSPLTHLLPHYLTTAPTTTTITTTVPVVAVTVPTTVQLTHVQPVITTTANPWQEANTATTVATTTGTVATTPAASPTLVV